MADKPLSDRQMAFVLAYVGPAKGVGVQAAKQAGYAGNEAVLDVQARRLLGNARVMLEIEKHRAKVIEAGVATSQEVAVRLTAMGMGMVKEVRIIGGKDDFIEAEVTMPGTVQVSALKGLIDMMGYAAPTKTEHTGAVALEVSLTPDVEAALEQWLMVRNDPRVIAVIEELCG